MSARTTAEIARCLKAFGKSTESSIKRCGWTQDEIDAAVKSGAVKRTGSRMGGISLRYLSV